MLREATALFLSVVASVVCFIYILGLPFLLLPAHAPLLRKHYHDSLFPNVFVDILSIALYLAVALVVTRLAPVPPFAHALIVAGVAAAATSVVCVLTQRTVGGEKLVNRYLSASHPFRVWFDELGYKAILYDVVIVLMSYFVYKSMLLRAEPAK